MPNQHEVQWSQLKVGVLVIVALVALTALIFLMSGSSGGFFSGKLQLRSYFEDSAGLKIGAPVTLEGVTIGNVKAIRIVPSRKLTPVEVTMKVSRRFREALHEDSRTSLETVGVLGDTVVQIDSRHATGPEVKNNDELPTTETPNLSDVIKSSQGTIDQLNTILAKVNTIVDSLNSGKGSVGQLINNPDLYNKANATVNQLQGLINQVSSGRGSIGKLMTDDSLYNNLNEATNRLNRITTEIEGGQGTVGRLVKDPSLYNNLNQTAANANKLLVQINQGQGALGMMAKDPAFQRRLRNTVTRLDSVVTRIDNGEGTIGQLVRNPELYNNSDQMLTETRNLVTSVRENPKKYLTFKVKIF